MTETSQAPGSAPLNGWKEIAGYLGRSVRAAQRYERELGLPVHRLHTEHGQTVYAFPTEIDRWRRDLDAPPERSTEVNFGSVRSAISGLPDGSRDNRPEHVARPTPGETDASGRVTWKRQAIAWAAAGLLIALGLAFGLRGELTREPSPDVPVAYQWRGQAVNALDANDHVLWSHRFDRNASAVPGVANQGGSAIDLDGDGVPELIVPVRFAPHGAELVTTDGVYVFSSDGRPLRTVVPDLQVTCGTQTFGGPWALRAIAASTGTGPKHLWLAFVHNTWRPSFVLDVTPNRTASVRYVQSGWIFSLTEWNTPAGRLLAAGGVMNEQELASVALIDTAGETAASPASTAKDACSAGPSRPVRRVFLFPRLEVTEPRSTYDSAGRVHAVGSDLKVSYGDSSAIVRLTPDFQIASYALADSFFRRHEELEAKGLLDHPAEECPFVGAEKEIREWTPLAGWQILYVPAAHH